jgi:hypothetical protein
VRLGPFGRGLRRFIDAGPDETLFLIVSTEIRRGTVHSLVRLCVLREFDVRLVDRTQPDGE